MDNPAISSPPQPGRQDSSPAEPGPGLGKKRGPYRPRQKPSSPSPTGEGGQIPPESLDELKASFPVESSVLGGDGTLDLKPEEVEALLAMLCLGAGNALLEWRKRELITAAEAERWGKCTRMVFWKYINRVEAGMVVWAVVTAGVLMKPPRKEVSQ